MTPMEMVEFYGFIKDTLSAMARHNQFLELENPSELREHQDDEDLERLNRISAFFSCFNIDYEFLTSDYWYIGLRLAGQDYIIPVD